MTEQERRKITVRVKNNKYLTRSETDYIVNMFEEVQKYHDLEQKLNGVDLVMLANHWMEMAAEGEVKGYQRGRVLTNEDADQWDAYKAIGTPAECRLAVEKQIPKKPKEYEDKFYACPTCGNVLLHKWEKYPTKLMDKKNGLPYCLGCGQKLDWSDEE